MNLPVIVFDSNTNYDSAESIVRSAYAELCNSTDGTKNVQIKQAKSETLGYLISATYDKDQTYLERYKTDIQSAYKTLYSLTV